MSIYEVTNSSEYDLGMGLDEVANCSEYDVEMGLDEGGWESSLQIILAIWDACLLFMFISQDSLGSIFR